MFGIPFLAQPILWGLFAVAIPVIIHLLNRRRFRTVKWAATTFLLKAARESRGRKKLKHILILTCRALAIAALIFAVARPLVGGLLGSGGGSVGTVLLVLDRSASMELKAADGEPSQRESVINKISDAVTNLGSPRLVLLDSASGKIQDVPSPDALTDLSATAATDTEADIPTLLANAIDYLQETTPGRTEIWLASDLQRENWRPSDSRWNAVTAGIENLPTKTTLRIITAETEEVENFSIELLSSRRIENDLFLDLRLVRRGSEGPVTLPIGYSLMGARSPELVTIEGQELRFQKRLPLSAADESGFGWVDLPADNNPRDNSAYFAFGGKEPVKSWIVAENPSSDIAEYLQAAAAPVGLDRFTADIVSTSQTAAIDWSTASLIIWQAPLPTGAIVTQLTDFASSGGSIVFFPPEGDTSESFFGISWGEIELAPAKQFFINGTWRKDDGPWSDTVSGASLPIDQLRGLKRRSIQGDLPIFAEWDDGSPLMARQLEGLGTAIFISTLPDDRWSNLENTGLHIAAIQRMAQKGNDRLHAGYRAYAGEEKTETKGEEVRERLDSFEQFEPVMEGYRAGVYRLGDRTLAVNRPPSENSPARLDEGTLDELLKDVDYSLFSNDNSKSDLISEAWRAFLIAMLLFLIAEALLCLQPKRGNAPLPASAAAPSRPRSTPSNPSNFVIQLVKNFNFGPLHLQASTLTIVFVVVVLVAAITLSVMAVRRSARPKRTGILEGLRFLCILLACAMLFGPEWRTTQDSDLQPEIAILWDDSGSMTTEDAERPDSVSGNEEILSRKELVDRLLEKKFWSAFEAEGRNRVSIDSFSSVPTDGDEVELSMAGTDVNAALSKTLESGRNLRAVVLIGDGDWNQGNSPSSAAQQYRLKGIPIYPLVTGNSKRLPDLDLESVTAPTYGIVSENVQIPFTIQSSLARDVRTQVRIRSDSGKESYKDITIRANSPYYGSILWRIEKDGPSTLELSIPLANGELVESNNSRSFTINGEPESIKVLVIETLPRWEYRFIRNALSRDPGVDVDCLLLHPQLGKGDGPDYIQEFPEKLEDLQKYDVVFVGDIGVGEGQLTAEQANLIRGLVENQASGVVFIPGPQGNQFTLDTSDPDDPDDEGDLADLIPVELDPDRKEGFSESIDTPMRLTREGEKSLLTMLGDDEAQNEIIWRGLPGFYWQAPVKRAKAGATILAVNDARRNNSGRLPILVTSRAGSGKVLYMAIDSAWRWRRGVEDLYHYRFWGQVARWMSYQRNMAAGERVRLFYAPERPKPGDRVTLAANAFDENGAPLSEGVLQVDLTAPDGTIRSIGLAKKDGSWGRFTGEFEVSQPGEWKMKAFVPEDPGAFVEANLLSLTDRIEKTGKPARFEVLDEVAKVSRGRRVTPDQLASLVKEINALPEPQPLVNSIKLWAHWLAPTILITLLALFWIGRKLNGTF